MIITSCRQTAFSNIGLSLIQRTHLAWPSSTSTSIKQLRLLHAQPRIKNTRTHPLFGGWSNARQHRRYSTFQDSQPLFQKIARNRNKLAITGLVLGLGLFTDPKEVQFYIGSLARAVVAGVAGVSTIADYKLNWPTQKDADSEEELAALRSAIHLRNATRILEAMKFNGGVYIKLGQHLSALGYILPLEWTETFRPLHDQCPATSKQDIEELFRTDLGTTLDELFVEFDDTPIGVASIAQVHRARLRETDQEVAVKLQHPKVSRYSLLDLRTTTMIVRLAKWALPAFEFEWLAEEMNRNMPLELDFTIEGENATRAMENFSKGKTYALKIPEVYWATQRVICMEFVLAAKLDDHEYMKKNGINPNQVSREITHIFSEMIYNHGWVHCDAHPGNLMLRATDFGKGFEVVLLDHGLYRYLSLDFRLLYAKLWKSIINRDMKGMKEYSLALGGTPATFKLISHILTGQSWSTLEKSFSGHKVVAKDRSDQSVRFISILPDLASLLAQVPRELIFLFKTQDLLKLVHQDLGATQDQKVQYLIMARHCSRAIFLSHLNATLSHSFSITQGVKLLGALFNYFMFRVELNLYLALLSIRFPFHRALSN